MPAEMERILALPTFEAPPPIPHGIALPDGIALRPPQDAALRWWRAALHSASEPWGGRGVLLGAGCGSGKTLAELLLPAVPEAPGYEDTLYLVPARLMEQLQEDANAWRSKGFPIGAAVFGGVRSFSHEFLSSPRGRSVLLDTRPRTIVIDEAHKFGSVNSGRWRRIAEYIRAFPDTRIVILSGSLTGRSLRDWRHLAVAALRDWSPLPADSTIDYWAAAMDPRSEPDNLSLGVVEPLANWSHDNNCAPTSPREAFFHRLRSAPGVVLTAEANVGASLTIEMWRPETHADSVVDAFDVLFNRWELPDGEEIESSAAFARHARTLALGGWNRWKPGTADPRWVSARREWLKHQRALVEYNGRTYQTPGAVVAALERGELAGGVRAAWEAWKQAERKYPAPETEWVWMDGAEEYLAALVGAFVDKLRADGHREEGAVIWTHSPEIGRKLAELLGASYHGAGSNPPAGGMAVASILAHGTGWNTGPKYGYSAGFVVEPPTGGVIWEQLLARLHREGQLTDVDFYVFAPAFSSMSEHAMNVALKEARYSRESTGADQRLLTANWLGMRVDRA